MSGQYEIKILPRTTLNDGIDMKNMILLMILKITEQNLEEVVDIQAARLGEISSGPDIVWETIFHTRGR